MEVIKYPSREEWAELAKRPALDVTTLFDTVRTVLDEVRKEGDAAVIRYEEKFDKINPATFTALQVSEVELQEAEDLVSDDLKQAICQAKENIEIFHASQRFVGKKVETTPGVTCWQKAVAIEKVGLYVPGGTAPLFSTVLMLAIPARIAGCKEIVLCTPPNREGKVHPAILFAAKVAGVSKIFKTGGIQAIAAMAFGTETIPRVDKITGPGNIFVTLAKKAVYGHCDIDMLAGPSEILIVADKTADPAYTAADMRSQAEHDMLASSIVITDSPELAEKVAAEAEKQLKVLPREEITRASLDRNGMIIITEDIMQAVELANVSAPEHMEVLTEQPFQLLPYIRHAGAVFLGAYSPEPLGDYFAGPNHVLPTGGTALFPIRRNSWMLLAMM